ncbi:MULTISPECIES: glucose-6-phosphate dehydrogenase assembly protein OpcA [Gardnerella]|uniref:glucose-6-phosphate dehydrogenase assembly protein OpcA n=1 Tax=Gardnerella TaxID=2701 RepID=UPI0003544D9E|nr:MULTISPECIES: glucose-6-phosphate dehydrogenase assembly protein OpcA [Gardnerella]EPI55068.1 putative opcA protein [Gardnerella pickettii JCP7659]KXA16066.1 putative opcA protein [Gardnerella pickettii]MDF2278512.1 glucose-6-phosphate dehydrogenase assembly protein OpcA [Gardnerella pickettii]NSX25880.1 glucose-6-phosphate dehydrogenase assembly protein OpcA [Gardnerella vaginalis]PKZ40006.1 OpcA protein [Gardnerella pickettii]
MIINLPNTNTSKISAKIDELHEERGESATGRVLTLLIDTTLKELENALGAANAASREHPCRVIAIVRDWQSANASLHNQNQGNQNQGNQENQEEETPNLDAQVRFGADAGAGEIIILYPHNDLVRHPDTLVIPLLVPDAPIVAWWPTNAPENPAKDLLGAMASSRITDAQRASNTLETVQNLRKNWSSKDVDLSWTRITSWRAMLASMLDQPPHLPILSVKVSGPKHYVPLHLLAQWLKISLNVPVEIVEDSSANAITEVSLKRQDGELSLVRPSGSSQAIISLPGQASQPISMPIRSLQDCLSEELRRIDPDEIYAQLIHANCCTMQSNELAR